MAWLTAAEETVAIRAKGIPLGLTEAASLLPPAHGTVHAVHSETRQVACATTAVLIATPAVAWPPRSPSNAPCPGWLLITE